MKRTYLMATVAGVWVFYLIVKDWNHWNTEVVVELIRAIGRFLALLLGF